MDKTTLPDGSIDFVITKASLGDDGVMRWAATVSKFAADKQDDEVTPEFYRSAIQKAEDGIVPMPALVVSHYDDPREESMYEPVPEIFRAGETTAMYIDGELPKAKGIFLDTELGKATYKAVREDIQNDVPYEQRTRISMAFRPDPGGVEKAETGVNRYLRGMIRHFATTRHPIVPETEIVAEPQVEKSDRVVTRFDDAASIVGPELAKSLDESYRKIIRHKAENTLIEKAEDSEDAMGNCISTKLSEGWERERAIAACINMTKGKGDYMDPDVEMGEMDMDSCVNEYIAKGFSHAAAQAACRHQSRLVNSMNNNITVPSGPFYGEMYMGKSKAEMKMADCMKAAMETDGMTEDEAREKCGYSRMDKSETTLDDVLDTAISDGEVQVVKSEDAEAVEPVNQEADEAVETETLDEAEKSEAAETVGAVPEEVTAEVDSQETAVEAVEDGVNDSAQKAETVPPSNSSGVDQLITMYKAALEDSSMSRSEKTAAVNMVLEGMAEIARNEIQNLPMSPDEQADALKSAIEEATAPLMNKIGELEAFQTLVKAAFQEGDLDTIFKSAAPQPKGLRPVVTKSEAEDTGGALSSRQIAAKTVIY